MLIAFKDLTRCKQCVLYFQHSGHTFKPLDSVYDEHVKKIDEELNQLKRRHIELISLVQDVVSLCYRCVWVQTSCSNILCIFSLLASLYMYLFLYHILHVSIKLPWKAIWRLMSGMVPLKKHVVNIYLRFCMQIKHDDTRETFNCWRPACVLIESK